MEKSALFTDRLPHAEIPIDGVGTITIRALNRAELLLASKGIDEDDPHRVLKMERRMLSMALTDPVISEKDAERWQLASKAGEIKPVMEMINQLSGIGSPDAVKEQYKSLPGES